MRLSENRSLIEDVLTVLSAIADAHIKSAQAIAVGVVANSPLAGATAQNAGVLACDKERADFQEKVAELNYSHPDRPLISDTTHWDGWAHTQIKQLADAFEPITMVQLADAWTRLGCDIAADFDTFAGAIASVLETSWRGTAAQAAKAANTQFANWGREFGTGVREIGIHVHLAATTATQTQLAVPPAEDADIAANLCAIIGSSLAGGAPLEDACIRVERGKQARNEAVRVMNAIYTKNYVDVDSAVPAFSIPDNPTRVRPQSGVRALNGSLGQRKDVSPAVARSVVQPEIPVPQHLFSSSENLQQSAAYSSTPLLSTHPATTLPASADLISDKPAHSDLPMAMPTLSSAMSEPILEEVGITPWIYPGYPANQLGIPLPGRTNIPGITAERNLTRRPGTEMLARTTGSAPGSQVPPSAAKRDNDKEYRTSAYLVNEHNGHVIIGELPRVIRPVIGQ